MPNKPKTIEVSEIDYAHSSDPDENTEGYESSPDTRDHRQFQSRPGTVYVQEGGRGLKILTI